MSKKPAQHLILGPFKEVAMRFSRIVCLVFVFGLLTPLLYAADINGKWTSESDQGPQWTFHFKAEGNKLTGSMIGSDGKERPVNEGKLEGNALSFSVDSEWQGEPVKLIMKGKVSGDEMQLRVDTEDGAWGTDIALKRTTT
jgi:hypothetical protein